MHIYLLSAGVSLFFAYLAELCYIKKNNIWYSKKTSKNKNYFNINYFILAVFSFLPLFIISAVRYEVGTDYAGTYKEIYYKILQSGNVIRDSLYGVINKIAQIYSSDYTGVFILTSFLFCLFIFCAIFQQSYSPKYSILLLIITCVYFISLNMVRQSIATAIFIYSIKFIRERNLLKYLFFIIIAFGIHSMALIFLPIYFIHHIKLQKKGILILIAVFFLQNIFGFIIEKIVMNIPFLSKYFAYYYFSVFNTEKFNTWSFMVNLAILALFIFIGRYVDANDNEYTFWLNLQYLVVIILLCSKIIPLAQRISWLLAFSQIISIPIMIKFIKKPLYRLFINVGIITGFTLYMYITIVIRGYHEVLPYKTIFGR